MIGRETRVLLRHYLEEGASKAEVARRLGVSRCIRSAPSGHRHRSCLIVNVY